MNEHEEKKEEVLNKVGRPTDYNEEILTKTREYISLCEDSIEDYQKSFGKTDTYERIVKVKLPSIEGLAVFLKVGRPTIYDWEQKHPEFSYILEELRAKQAEALLNNGLSGDYSPVIAKLILSKHGYKEQTDITTDGKAINIVFDPAFNKNGTPQQTETDSTESQTL